jgi:hypothetical protein
MRTFKENNVKIEGEAADGTIFENNDDVAKAFKNKEYISNTSDKKINTKERVNDIAKKILVDTTFSRMLTGNEEVEISKLDRKSVV